MERASIAVNAPMLAAAIRVDARFETDIRAIVVSDNFAGAVLEKLRARQRVFLRVPIRIRFQMNLFETIGRIAICAARWQRSWAGTHSKSVIPYWAGINR